VSSCPEEQLNTLEEVQLFANTNGRHQGAGPRPLPNALGRVTWGTQMVTYLSLLFLETYRLPSLQGPLLVWKYCEHFLLSLFSFIQVCLDLSETQAARLHRGPGAEGNSRQ
jgi:hypothetical protein